MLKETKGSSLPPDFRTVRGVQDFFEPRGLHDLKVNLESKEAWVFAV